MISVAVPEVIRHVKVTLVDVMGVYKVDGAITASGAENIENVELKPNMLNHLHFVLIIIFTEITQFYAKLALDRFWLFILGIFDT